MGERQKGRNDLKLASLRRDRVLGGRARRRRVRAGGRRSAARASRPGRRDPCAAGRRRHRRLPVRSHDRSARAGHPRGAGGQVPPVPYLHRAKPRSSRSRRWALVTFAVLLVAVVPTILELEHHRWFILDYWDFLTQRRLGSFSYFMPPHNAEHWSTLPIIAWRTMYGVVGMHHYWHYQLMIVALHLTAVVLLRLVMRRAGSGRGRRPSPPACCCCSVPDRTTSSTPSRSGSSVPSSSGCRSWCWRTTTAPCGTRDWLGLVAGAAWSTPSPGLGVTMVVVVVSVWMRRWRCVPRWATWRRWRPSTSAVARRGATDRRNRAQPRPSRTSR